MKTEESTHQENTPTSIPEFSIFNFFKDLIFFPDKAFGGLPIGIIWLASFALCCILFLEYFYIFKEGTTIGQCIFFGVAIGIANAMAHIKKDEVQLDIVVLSILMWVAVFPLNALHIPDVKMGWLMGASFLSGITCYYWMFFREKE